MNLLDSVKGVMTNAVVDKAASVLGIENGMMKSALKLALPAIIGGLINKGSSESGAGGLIDLFKNGGFGDNNNSDLIGVLGDDAKRGGMLETGADLLGTIFGNNQSGILDMILKSTGIGKSGGSSILSFLAPIVINKLAGIVFGDKMSASGLSKYLGGQKSEIMGLVPGMSSLLGGSAAVNETVGAVSGSSNNDDDSGGGMGFMKYLLPLLILAGLSYWWMNRDKATTTDVDEAKTEIATDKKEIDTRKSTTTEPAVDVDIDPSEADTDIRPGYSVNANGDIVDENGKVLFASGTYEFDANGNLVDKTNKRIILPVTSITKDLAGKINSMLSGQTGTEVTMEEMKTIFNDMIMKKSSKTSYGLTNIEFNKENHKISNFSKAEVMGLAEALKSNVDGKIEVQVYTADGDDEKANDKLSDTRANVIRDMLVTLGVDKKQISAQGMGDSNREKANAGKVDIVIR